MAALTAEMITFITAMFQVVFDILTPAAAGATPLQIIVYSGFGLAFVTAGAVLVKRLANG